MRSTMAAYYSVWNWGKRTETRKPVGHKFSMSKALDIPYFDSIL
jgi:hypothetical protein